MSALLVIAFVLTFVGVGLGIASVVLVQSKRKSITQAIKMCPGALRHGVHSFPLDTQVHMRSV